MNTDIEPVLSGLLSHLAARVSVSFTGDTAEASADISNVSSFTGLFVGLGVVGPNLPADTAIDAIDTGAGTITLSQQATGDGTAETFTGGFQTTGRRIRYAKDVTSQPALYLRHTADETEYNGGILPIRTIEAELVLFSRAGEDPNAIPDTALNNLIRAIYEAMAPDDSMQFRFTIGGLCQWCRIDGRSEYDDGALDKQSKAALLIKITLP
jgi:hypothetical protein